MSISPPSAGAALASAGRLEDDEAGVSVAGAGDLNGDGRPEVLVSAPGADNNGRSESGTVYALAGDAAANVNLGALPAGSLASTAQRPAIVPADRSPRRGM